MCRGTYPDGMRSAPGRLAAVDEANLVLDHVGQVNVFLIAGMLSPGGFMGDDGRADLGVLRMVLHERIAELPPLCRAPSGGCLAEPPVSEWRCGD